MTRIEIAALACKIIGLWFFADSVTGIVGMIIAGVIAIGDFSPGNGLKEALVLGIVPLGQLVVGSFLWFGASRLAPRMVVNNPTPVTRSDITAPDVLAIAFVTIGVSTLIPHLRGLVRNIYEMMHGEYRFAEWISSGRTWSMIVGFAISIWLILGSRGIVHVVFRARAAAARRGGEAEPS